MAAWEKRRRRGRRRRKGRRRRSSRKNRGRGESGPEGDGLAGDRRGDRCEIDGGGAEGAVAWTDRDGAGHRRLAWPGERDGSSPGRRGERNDRRDPRGDPASRIDRGAGRDDHMVVDMQGAPVAKPTSPDASRVRAERNVMCVAAARDRPDGERFFSRGEKRSAREQDGLLSGKAKCSAEKRSAQKKSETVRKRARRSEKRRSGRRKSWGGPGEIGEGCRFHRSRGM